MKPVKILIVDDDPLFLQTTQEQLSLFGFHVSTAKDGSEGDRLAESEELSLILLDLRLPDTDGLTLLKKWQARGFKASIIMVSGSGTIPEAVSSLKCGAVDFLVKPIDIDILEAVVNRTLTSRKLQKENRRLRELARIEKVEFLGISQVVRDLLATAEKIALSDYPVLLEGETGTGKEVLAGNIYSRSDRAGEPFVRVNCAAITPTLFESELFGHEKGAFTSAHAQKAGKFELVGGGTLFLDEIGEIPQECQAKLLTAVEDRIFERVGGTTVLNFDGRIIAATNRNLEQEVSKGNFRKDLFYRLNTFRMKLPPLRERPEDIPIHIEQTLEQCRRKYGRAYQSPDEEIMKQLVSYPWQGNVRELIHHVERIALLSSSAAIPRKLWLSLPVGMEETSHDIEETNLQDAANSFKKQHVLKVLANCGGNQTEAAKKLGIGRTYLNRLIAGFKQQE